MFRKVGEKPSAAASKKGGSDVASLSSSSRSMKSQRRKRRTTCLCRSVFSLSFFLILSLFLVHISVHNVLNIEYHTLAAVVFMMSFGTSSQPAIYDAEDRKALNIPWLTQLEDEHPRIKEEVEKKEEEGGGRKRKEEECLAHSLF